MELFISTKGFRMVRFVLACPYTVVSMILLSIVRSRRYASNCVRVLGNSVSWLFWDTISPWLSAWYDMEHPSSMVQKSMVCICAITLIRLIGTIIVRPCLWELIVPFSNLMLRRLPPIGGEPSVQIFNLIIVCVYLDWRQVIALAANGIYGMSWWVVEWEDDGNVDAANVVSLFLCLKWFRWMCFGVECGLCVGCFPDLAVLCGKPPLSWHSEVLAFFRD